MGLGEKASFEFHVGNWIGNDDEDGFPIRPRPRSSRRRPRCVSTARTRPTRSVHISATPCAPTGSQVDTISVATTTAWPTSSSRRQSFPINGVRVRRCIVGAARTNRSPPKSDRRPRLPADDRDRGRRVRAVHARGLRGRAAEFGGRIGTSASCHCHCHIFMALVWHEEDGNKQSLRSLAGLPAPTASRRGNLVRAALRPHSPVKPSSMDSTAGARAGQRRHRRLRQRGRSNRRRSRPDAGTRGDRASHRQAEEAVKRGDVFWADLAPRSGSEQSGRRPVVVVSNDGFNPRGGVAVGHRRSTLHVSDAAAPRSDRDRGPEGRGRLAAGSVALCHQVTTLDRAKLVTHVGELPTAIRERVDDALRGGPRPSLTRYRAIVVDRWSADSREKVPRKAYQPLACRRSDPVDTTLVGG